MGTFVTGPDPLPPPKSNVYAPDDPTHQITAEDINGLWNAAGDLRTALAGVSASRSFSPDANDLLRYALDETSDTGPWVNSGSAGTANLTVLQGAVASRSGLYPGASGALGRGVAFRGTIGDIIGGAASVEPPYPITLSLWWMTTGTPTSCQVFEKKYRPVSQAYTAPNATFGMSVGDSNPSAFLAIGGTRTVITPTSNAYDRIAIGMWHLLVSTYDGSVFRLYMDGVQVASTAITGALDYGTHGEWANGQSLSGGTNLMIGILDEIRVANVARSASWVASYWRTVMMLT